VAKGKKEICNLELRVKRLESKIEREFLNSKVFGERILRSPDGRGRSWKRTRRRKNIRMADGSPVKFAPHCTGQGLRMADWWNKDKLFLADGWWLVADSEIKDVLDLMESIAQRMKISRMPSSMMENAQSSMEPKAMGVKIIRKMRMSLMNKFNIAQSSKLKAQRKI
jgi:hypothetical protein